MLRHRSRVCRCQLHSVGMQLRSLCLCPQHRQVTRTPTQALTVTTYVFRSMVAIYVWLWMLSDNAISVILFIMLFSSVVHIFVMTCYVGFNLNSMFSVLNKITWIMSDTKYKPTSQSVIGLALQVFTHWCRKYLCSGEEIIMAENMLAWHHQNHGELLFEHCTLFSDKARLWAPDNN